MTMATSSTSGGGSLRQRLLKGYKAYGPMLFSDSQIIAEILSLVGYDFIIIDHEHSPSNIYSSQTLLRAIDAGNQAYYANRHRSAVHSTLNHQTNLPDIKQTTLYPTESIIRLPSPNDPVYMKKVLDSIRLPAGVLVPMVETKEMAEQIVQSIRYPSQFKSSSSSRSDHQIVGGIRGCAIPFIRSNYYGLLDTTEEYLEKCQNDLLVMIQIETLTGINNLPSILSEVEGIDGIFLGPFDISASIGHVGQWEHPIVQETIQTAEELIRSSSSNCLLAGFQPPFRTTSSMFHDHQYSLVCNSIDIGLLRQAAIHDYQRGMKAKTDSTKMHESP
jgi:4-hydroxy-2-oxoheptanedioate aldolase